MRTTKEFLRGGDKSSSPAVANFMDDKEAIIYMRFHDIGILHSKEGDFILCD